MSRRSRPDETRLALFDRDFLADLAWWIETDRAVALRLLRLVDEILRDPFHGIGKPEPLRHALRGAWSRRLTAEHRVVYLVPGTGVRFLQARYHY